MVPTSVCFRIVAAAAAAGLVACGGGRSAPPVTAAAPAAPAAPGGGAASAAAQIVVTLPARSTSGRRRVHTLAANVASLKIAQSTPGSTPVVANLSPSASGCATTAGTTTCTIPLAVPLGAVTFTVGSYDGANAAGNLLGTAVVPVTIRANASNTIAVTLDGVLAGVNLVLSPPVLAPGTPASATLTVVAYDTDGNVIAGPGRYADAADAPVVVSVTSADTSGHVRLAGGTTGTVAGPSSASLAVAYDGSGFASGAAVAFTATIGGTPRASASIAFGTPGSSIYVADSGSSRIFTFPAGSSGAATAVRSIDPILIYPEQMAYDAAGNLYITDDNGNRPPLYQERVQIFAAGASGNVAPMRSIAGPATGFGQSGGISIYGVAVDAQNDLWVAYRSGGTPTIAVFAPGATGNAAPLGTITGLPSATYSQPLAFDAGGNLWYGNGNTIWKFSSASLTAVRAGASGPVTPAAQIVGALTTLSNVGGLGFDATGNLYVAQGTSNGSVLVFAAGATGNLAPARTIGGLRYPGGFGFDGSGRFYVNDESGYGFVRVFTAGTSGSATPVASIAAPNAYGFNCFQAAGVAPNGTTVDVLDNCTMAVYRWPFTASGTAAPSSTLFAPVAYPYGLFVDAQGAQYVPNGQNPGIAVIPPGASGAPQASRFIAGPATGIGYPNGVWVDGTGNLYVTGDACCGGVKGVLIFGPAANGNVAPLRTIAGPTTGILRLVGRPAVDAAGNVYVIDNRSRVLVFAAGASGDVAPVRTIPITGSANALYVDPAGTIYVLNNYPGTAVNVINAGQTTIARTITTTLPGQQDLFVDAAGAVYLQNQNPATNTVSVFASGASGASSPTSTFDLSAVGAFYPLGIAIGP